MKSRPVHISELEIEDFDGRDATLRVRCSSGTYIRSLARDIALAAGSRARLDALERLEVGPFSLSGARAPDAIEAGRDLRLLDPGLASILGLEPFLMDERTAHRFLNGGKIELADIERIPSGEGGRDRAEESGLASLAMFSREGLFHGMMGLEAGKLSYRFVIGPAS
jgi:tRNA U55 pseudouridine synthase TruB